MNTLFLATVIGWYLIITSLFLLLRHKQVKAVMTDILANRGLFFILAVITLIFGLLMVASHNLWVMEWTVVVTILSWLVLISGLIRLFFPEIVIKKAHFYIIHSKKMTIPALVSIFIGLFLLFNVYYTYN